MKHIHLAILLYMSAILLLACSKDGVSNTEPESSSSISSSSLASSSSNSSVPDTVTLTGRVVRSDGLARYNIYYSPVPYTILQSVHLLETPEGIWRVDGADLWPGDSLTIVASGYKGRVCDKRDCFGKLTLLTKTMERAAPIRDTVLAGRLSFGARSCADSSQWEQATVYSSYVLCLGAQRIHLASLSGAQLYLPNLVDLSFTLSGRYLRDSSRFSAPGETASREWLYVSDSTRNRLDSTDSALFTYEDLLAPLGYRTSDYDTVQALVIREPFESYNLLYVQGQWVELIDLAGIHDLSTWVGDSLTLVGVLLKPGDENGNYTLPSLLLAARILAKPVNRDSTFSGTLSSSLKACPDTTVASNESGEANFVLCNGTRRINIAERNGSPLYLYGLDHLKGKVTSLTGRYVYDSVNYDKPVSEWLYLHDSVKTRLLTK